MKLFNVIMIHDVYVVAESPEDARATLAAFVKEQARLDDLKLNESTALEARSENNVRESWRKERPLVGNSVSDADFAKLKGKGTAEIYKMIYTKEEPTKKVVAK